MHNAARKERDAGPEPALSIASSLTDNAIDEYLVDLPAIPAIAIKVLHLVEDPNTSGNDLTHALSADQAITYKVLQLANSAYYGMSRQIDSLKQAVSILGMMTIRSLVLLYSVPASLKRGGKTGAEESALWEHAMGVAIVSRSLAARAGGLEPERLFLAGMLHDIGKTVLLLRAPDRMSEVLYAAWPPGGSAGIRAERSTFGFDHEQIGERVLNHWTFPALFPAAARRHHDPDKAEGFETEVRIVAAANHLAHHMGLGGPADPDAWGRAVSMGEILGLDAAVLEEVSVAALNQITAERKLYDI